MTSWQFKCRLGLKQGACNEYERDDRSRGAGRLGGCPSCVHRKPDNEDTIAAEDYHERNQALKELGF